MTSYQQYSYKEKIFKCFVCTIIVTFKRDVKTKKKWGDSRKRGLISQRPGRRPRPTSTDQHPALPGAQPTGGAVPKEPSLLSQWRVVSAQVLLDKVAPIRKSWTLHPDFISEADFPVLRCQKKGETMEQWGKGNWSLKQRFLD